MQCNSVALQKRRVPKPGTIQKSWEIAFLFHFFTTLTQNLRKTLVMLWCRRCVRLSIVKIQWQWRFSGSVHTSVNAYKCDTMKVYEIITMHNFTVL